MTHYGSSVIKNQDVYSDYELHFLSGSEVNFLNVESNPSTSSVLVYNLIVKENRESIKTDSKTNLWYIHKELYKREIGYNNTCRIWSDGYYKSDVALQKLQMTYYLRGNKDYLNSMDFSKTGNILVNGSHGGSIILWNWQQKTKPLLIYKNPSAKRITHIKFLTNQGNDHIVTAGKDERVNLVVMNNSGIIYTQIIAHHNRPCSKIGSLREIPYVLLSCGKDGIVNHIDIRESPSEVKKILHIRFAQGNDLPLYGIDINPLNPFEFIINGEDEIIRMYDQRKLSYGPVKTFYRSILTRRLPDEHNDRLLLLPRNYTSAVYNYCGTEILASYGEHQRNDVVVYDINNPHESFLHRHISEENQDSSISAINFYGPRSDYVVYGLDNGFIIFIDKKTKAVVHRIGEMEQGKVTTIKGHPQIPVLATSARSSGVQIWEPSKNSQPQNIQNLQNLTSRLLVDNKVYRVNVSLRSLLQDTNES